MTIFDDFKSPIKGYPLPVGISRGEGKISNSSRVPHSMLAWYLHLFRSSGYPQKMWNHTQILFSPISEPPVHMEWCTGLWKSTFSSPLPPHIMTEDRQ